MTRTTRRGRSVLVGFSVVAALAVMAPAAGARTHGPGNVIDVFPGRHALAKALAKAQPFDTVQIHAGIYKDAVTVVTHDLLIQTAGDGAVTVNGRCAAEATLAVRADNVSIQGQAGDLTVQGGTFYEADARFVQGGRFAGMTVTDTCGAAEYGINLYQAGHYIVDANVASGFGDAGIYVGFITNTEPDHLLVENNEVYGSDRGIIIEDVTPPALVIVYANRVHDNVTSGIHLHNSDGVYVLENVAKNNGAYGIDLDEFSDNNTVKRNIAKGHPYDLANLGGTGNCFRHNRYDTYQGSIGC
jgi:parallel beta-helix repeat protein